MTINVNNIPEEIKENSSLKEYLNTKNISVNGVAIAINDMVIRKQEWSVTLLQKDDTITIIQATQGG